MSEERIKTFPRYLTIGDKTIRIDGYIDDTQTFSNMRGYIKDGKIWIYRIEKPGNKKFPYFYDIEGERKFIDSSSECIREQFVVENLRDVSLDNIRKNTKPDDVFYDEKELRDMNVSTSVFVPQIKDTDDFLKKIVKSVFKEKKINSNRLKSKGPKSYTVSNMIVNLMSDTKTSAPMFLRWCELLGIKFTIIVEDNGFDPISPLESNIVYDQSMDRISIEKPKKNKKKETNEEE